MNYAYSSPHSTPSLAPLVSDARLSGDPAQHAAPRPMPASEVGTLRAGGIDPTPSDSREAAGGVQVSPLHAVSDQPVGRCNRCGDRCVQAGRLIADALCVGTENERNQEAAYRLNTRNSTTKLIPGAGVALACDASDQGSGVDRTEGVLVRT